MTKTISAKLLCGAVLASVALVEAPAGADPGDIVVDAIWNDAGGALYSGFNGVHTFNGPPTDMTGIYGAQFITTVTSGPSQRPGWTYEMTFDMNNFGLFNQGGGGSYWNISLVIKDDATNTPIIGYDVKNLAGVVIATNDIGSSPGTIRFSVLTALIDGPAGAGLDGFIVQWNQVPAPGALALLGIAGLAARRRRRSS